MTLDNYRLQVAKENNLIKEVNNEINSYNAKVELFCAGKLDDIQKEYPKLFLKNIKLKESKVKFEPQDYNTLVEEFNNERGMLLKKRKLQTIKPPTFLHFEAILHLYGKQLSKYTEQYIKAATTEFKPVRPVDINTYHIAALERSLDNETFVYSLPVSNATIRNNRNKLERAGILTNYKFRGHKKGVKMHISPKILVLFDAKTGKYTNAENQALTSQTCKKFTDKNKVNTRTLKSNINKKKNGQADFSEKGTASPDFSFVFYKNIPEQDEKSKLGGARENVKVSKNLSEKLENSIMHPQDFALRLAAGEFSNYNRIDKRILYQESSKGTMSRVDFKELIIQEFFKNAAKLYRTSTPFAGSWKKAINAYMDKMFIVNNGGGQTWLNSKEMMVDKLQELLWRLNSAHKWFLKTKVKPLYPSDYFDFTRKDKKEIGFEYTAKKYKEHLKYIENKPKLAKAVAKKAEIRAKNVNHSKKFEQKMNSFMRNRIQLPELIEYVDSNLPPNYLQKLSDYLLKIQTQYTC